MKVFRTKQEIVDTSALVIGTVVCGTLLSLSLSPSTASAPDVSPDVTSVEHSPFVMTDDHVFVYPNSLPPCPEEDGINTTTEPCYWDATTRGNGIGHSFISLPRN